MESVEAVEEVSSRRRAKSSSSTRAKRPAKTAAPAPRAPRPPKKEPGLVRPPAAEPVAAVHAILAELGITCPEDLDIEAIAAHHGLVAVIRRLAHEEGHMLSAGDVSLVTIDREVAARGGGHFVLAHELGHAVMQPGLDDFARCTRVGRSSGSRERENHANDFGSELTMPGPMFASFVGDAPPVLELLRAIAARFPASVDSAAIRLLLHTTLPCAAVCSIGGRVRWWARTPSFGTIVPWGARVDERTLASRLHRGLDAPRPNAIAAGVWDRSESDVPLVEEAMRLGESDMVLSWLVG